MKLRALTLAAAFYGLLAPYAFAQDPPAGPAKRPIEVFKDVRDLVNDGRFDLAAETIKSFLAIPPTDQDYLDIESRFGSTAILRLRNIPRWYDENKKDAEFRERADPKVPGSKDGPLEQLVKGSLKANERFLRDPKRVERYIGNLGASREEYLFAVEELRRSGDFVVPYMVTTLRTDNTPELRQGILAAVRVLGADTVPGFLAAVDGLEDELKVGILQALAARTDGIALVAKADTDFTAALWYLASAPADRPTVARNAAEILRQLTGGSSDTRQAAPELVRLATPLYKKTARFLAFDAAQNKVRYWEWDPAALTVRPLTLSLADAGERLGLKYLRWAVERRPGYEPAEEMFLALATERAVERGGFAELAKTDPGVYRVLTSAQSNTLLNLLETALTDNKTALAIGVIQVLGDRAEKTAAVPASKGTPSPLVRALSYPDPRVQFAAAVALLRIPHPSAVPNARVVEVLKRAAATDAGDGGKPPAAGKALIADPEVGRADAVASLLRGIGYATEQFGTGRELLRRVQQSADFDLVILDRHLGDPGLTDLLSQLHSDANFGRRPLLVVASADQSRPVALESLLLRLALLIAATETEDVAIPTPPGIDTRKSADDVAEDRRVNAVERDNAFARIYATRLGRLDRLVRSANVTTDDNIRRRLALRMPQLTYAGLIAEYDPPRRTAPRLYQEFEKISAQLRAQSDLDHAMENRPTESLAKLTLQLESVLTPQLRLKFEQLRRQVDPETLGIRPVSTRDPAAEASLARLVRTAPGAVVIPEPFSRVGFQEDVKGAVTDQAQLPRDPAEKKATARAAVEWLRRLAIGEIAGYDVRPAEPVLRQALANEDLAEPATDALARIPTTEAQQDLLKLAMAKPRPAGLRLRAADATARHIQAFGRLTPTNLIDQIPRAAAEAETAELRSRLESVRTLLGGSATDLSERIKAYSMPIPGSAAPKPAAAPVPPAAGGEPKKEKD